MRLELGFEPRECHKSVVKSVFGGGEDKAAKRAAERARKESQKQTKLLKEQQRQAEQEAGRIRLQRLSGAKARRAGTIGRKSLIATSELGVQETLG